VEEGWETVRFPRSKSHLRRGRVDKILIIIKIYLANYPPPSPTVPPPPKAGSAHPKKQEIYSIILEKKYSLKLDIIYFENFIKFKTQNKLYLYEHSLPPKEDSLVFASPL
jgi:hypothetical protein